MRSKTTPRSALRASTGLLTTLLATSSAIAAGTLDEYLRFRWYRIDVVIFERSDARYPGVARAKLLEAMRFPRTPVPLTSEAPTNHQPPFGQRLPVDDTAALVISNLAPPTWLVGECAAASWQPPIDKSSATDPCIPAPVDLEAEFPDDPHAFAAAVPTDQIDSAESLPLDAVAALRHALTEAATDHEKELMATSYKWRGETVAFAGVLGRLRNEFTVVAAGGWHQPVPPRDQPQPVLVQSGLPNGARRFPLEGWFSVTKGRYLHFEAWLQHRLPGGDTALLTERRRMRDNEPHYLDHPALGILAYAERVQAPAALQRLADELKELESASR